MAGRDDGGAWVTFLSVLITLFILGCDDFYSLLVYEYTAMIS